MAPSVGAVGASGSWEVVPPSLSDAPPSKPKRSNHGWGNLGSLIGNSLTRRFGEDYAPNLNSHALSASQYQQAQIKGNFEGDQFAALVNSIPITGFHSDFQMVAVWKHPDYRMVEIGFLYFVHNDGGEELVPISLVSVKNGEQLVGIDSTRTSSEAREALIEWFPAIFYEATLDVERYEDSEGNWRYHRHEDPSSDHAVISLPDGGFYKITLEGKGKPGLRSAIPSYDGTVKSALASTRLGNTMGHSISNFTPSIFADRYHLAVKPTVHRIDAGKYQSSGKVDEVEEVKIFKPLWLIKLAGEMSQTVMAATGGNSRWIKTDEEIDGMPVLEETITRQVNGEEKEYTRRWEPDLSQMDEGRFIYSFTNHVGRQEIVFDVIRDDSGKPLAFEQRGAVVKLWRPDGFQNDLVEYGRLEMQSSLPDHRYKMPETLQYTTPFRMTLYGHPTLYGEIEAKQTSDDVHTRWQLNIRPEAPRPASRRPMQVNLHFSSEYPDEAIRSSCATPTHVETYEHYPMPKIPRCE